MDTGTLLGSMPPSSCILWLQSSLKNLSVTILADTPDDLSYGERSLPGTLSFQCKGTLFPAETPSRSLAELRPQHHWPGRPGRSELMLVTPAYNLGKGEPDNSLLGLATFSPITSWWGSGYPGQRVGGTVNRGARGAGRGVRQEMRLRPGKQCGPTGVFSPTEASPSRPGGHRRSEGGRLPCAS